MAGGIWDQKDGDLKAYFEGSDAGALAASYIRVASGGVVQVGPGLEALDLSGLPAQASLIRMTQTGIFGIARFHILDPTDPTKSVTFDVSGVSGTKTITIPDRSGYLLLPATEGTDTYHLRSKGAGAAPVWEPVSAATNVLLDPTYHTDTMSGVITNGAIIVRDVTGVWRAQQPNGNLADVLTLVDDGIGGKTPDWVTPVAGITTHDGLPDTNTVAVASCTWLTTTNQITAAAGSFSNVKPGWFIYCGALTVHGSTASNWGRTVSSVSVDGSTITASATNTGSSINNGAMYFVSGDHWNNTVSVDTVSSATCTGAGLMLTAGRGDYMVGHGTTFQELRGPIRWMGAAGGGVQTDFRVNGSQNTGSGNPHGFMLMKQASGSIGMYFHTNDLTGLTVLRLGNPDTDRQLVVQTTNGSSITYDTVFGNDTHTARRTFQTPNINATIVGMVKVNTGDHAVSGGTNLSTQTLTAPPQGLYRISMRFDQTSNGTGTISPAFQYTNHVGADSVTVFNFLMDAVVGVGSWSTFSELVWVQSGNITYNTTGTWTGAGTLHVRIEAI